MATLGFLRPMPLAPFDASVAVAKLETMREEARRLGLPDDARSLVARIADPGIVDAMLDRLRWWGFT